MYLTVSHRAPHGFTSALLWGCGCSCLTPYLLHHNREHRRLLVFFRYSTLDNVDGKQARRTGSSSPLGELFEYAMQPIVDLICGQMLMGSFLRRHKSRYRLPELYTRESFSSRCSCLGTN